MRNKEVIRSYYKLIRFDTSLFSGLSVFLSGFLAEDLYGFQSEYLVAFLIVFLSAIGSFAFNDYYDFEVDKRNRRNNRPLVSGLLSKKVALNTGLLSFSLVLILSLLLNSVAFFLVYFSLSFFILYSLGMKKKILFKNILIAYAYVATIILGSVISDADLEPLTAYFATMGFIIGLAFEIMLDIGDVEGDRATGIKTISTRFGVKKAAKFSIVLFSVIMILDPLPFFVMIDPRLFRDYTFLSLIPVSSYFFISKSLIKNQLNKKIFKLKNRVFVTMQVGCLAYLIGTLF